MPRPPAGLCDTCVHQRLVRNTRGSEFSLCERSRTDPAYPRYPRLPVRECAGWEPGRDRAAEVLDRVRAVPPGFVTTYGDLCPNAPRFAGGVLAECDDPTVPWHRVVRADGSLAKGERQRRLLDAEGVPFRGARVDLAVARVMPEALE